MGCEVLDAPLSRGMTIEWDAREEHTMPFAGVNYLAILIAGVAGWLAGAAWYMSLGKIWVAALGWSREQAEAAKHRPHAWVPFVLVLVTNLVMAGALAGILGHFGTLNAKDGAITGALCWFRLRAHRDARQQHVRDVRQPSTG